MRGIRIRVRGREEGWERAAAAAAAAAAEEDEGAREGCSGGIIRYTTTTTTTTTIALLRPVPWQQCAEEGGARGGSRGVQSRAAN